MVGVDAMLGSIDPGLVVQIVAVNSFLNTVLLLINGNVDYVADDQVS